MCQSPSPRPCRPRNSVPSLGVQEGEEEGDRGGGRPWAPAQLPTVSVGGRPAWRGSRVAAGRTAVC